MDNIVITGYTEYITKQFDTFDSIAYEQYEEEMLASVIISANLDYAGVLLFDAGVTLRLPDIEVTEVQDHVPPWRRP